MDNILQQIIKAKRAALSEAMTRVSRGEMRDRAVAAGREVLSMSASLRAVSPLAVIAEFKRRSPSKGWIAPGGDPATVVSDYVRQGAAAVSVLTESDFFGGSVNDLMVARSVAPSLPILRKDFIIDPYQIDEARAIGADAILLIASALTPDLASELARHAHTLGLEVLLELHSSDELGYVDIVNPDMVGINNRRLADFVTDVAVAESMASMLPCGIVAVAESGVSGRNDVARLQKAGFGAFLVGEYLMRGHKICDLDTSVIE